MRHLLAIAMCVLLAGPAWGGATGVIIGGGSSSGIGDSSPDEILFNNAGGVDGSAGSTLDDAGNATFRTVSTDDLAPENVMVLNDNPAGMTKTAPLTKDVGIYIDSSADEDFLYLQDDGDNRYKIPRFETSGDIQTCLSGTVPAVGSGDYWCVSATGRISGSGAFSMYKVSGSIHYLVAKQTMVVDSTTATSEAFTWKLSVLGNDGGSGIAFSQRYWIDSDDLHEFFAGDGDTGIGLHDGDQNSVRTRIYPESGLASSNDVQLPAVSGILALDAGNIEDSTAKAINAAEMYGGFFVATANAFTYSLPVAVEGMHGCFWARTAAIYTIDPFPTDFMYLIGTGALANGVSVSSAGGIADSVCLRADSAGNWMMYAQNGTFVTP